MSDDQEPKKVEPKDEKPETPELPEDAAEGRSDGLADYPKVETHQTFRDA